jgi:multiple sugar transport system permease protein
MVKSKTTYNLREVRDAYAFNLPMILLALLFIIIPIIGTLITSFLRDVTFLSSKFIGLDNYYRLITDRNFLESLRFTMLFVIISVSIELVFGILSALILNESLRGRGLFRVALLIPWVIPVSISSRLWQLIYNYDYGILNYLLIHTGLISSPVNWLGTSAGAFISILIADIWKTTPFLTIIILAGLSSIQEELYQQAKIDGTNFIQRFFHITLPVLRPVLIVALLFRTIDAVRIFDIIYVLTGGGPGGKTTSLSLYAYRYYLTGDFGYGSSVSVLVFITVAILSMLYIKFGKFRESMR